MKKSFFAFTKLSTILLSTFFLFSCANFINDKFGVENNFTSESESVTNNNPSYIKPTEEDDNANEQLFSVWTGTTTLSNFNAKMGKNYVSGKYYYSYDGKASESEVEELKSTFSLSNSKKTKGECYSTLTSGSRYVDHSQINSLLSVARGWIIYCASSSEVIFLVKSDDSSCLTLSVAERNSSSVTLSFKNYGYVGTVYAFVDGVYNSSTTISSTDVRKGTLTLTGLSSGGHAIVLKNGSSSSSTNISNSTSVYIDSVSVKTELPFTISLSSYTLSAAGKLSLNVQNTSSQSRSAYIFLDGVNCYNSTFNANTSVSVPLSMSAGAHTIVLKDSVSSYANIISNTLTFTAIAYTDTSAQTYSVYTATTGLYNYNYQLNASLVSGKFAYKIDGTATQSQITTFKSKFSFTNSKKTKSECYSYFEIGNNYVATSYIDQLLSVNKGFIAFCPANSETVYMLLKCDDENSINLLDSESTSSSQTLSFINYGYVGTVYAFVDGTYDSSTIISSTDVKTGTLNLTNLPAGSHTIVLKNGSSSDSNIISNSTSLTVAATNTSASCFYTVELDTTRSNGVLNSGYYIYYFKYKLTSGSLPSKLYIAQPGENNNITTTEINVGSSSSWSVMTVKFPSSLSEGYRQFFLTNDRTEMPPVSNFYSYSNGSWVSLSLM